MSVRRYVSIVDIVVVVVVAVAIFLPARPLEGVAAARGDDDARATIAADEARVHLRADDGIAAQELSRRLIDVGEVDLGVEAPAVASRAMHGAPTQWRAILATSRAFAMLPEVKQALDWAQRAQGAYTTDSNPAYPAWEKLKVDLWVDYLQAGIASGVDPKVDPDRFRHEGESRMHLIHTTTNPQTAP